jgi:hypothetical protein
MQASGGICTGENLISNYTETVLNKKDEPLGSSFLFIYSVELFKTKDALAFPHCSQ